MKPEWRRFAPLGLYLAGLALLVAAGLYLVLRQFNLYVQISLGLAVIGLAAYALLDPEGVRQSFTGRQARYGSNALVLSVAFIGILVIINYLVFQNTKRWDLTEDKKNTLAPETVKTLQSLSQPVTAQAFFTQQTSSASAKQLLDLFQVNSQGRFTYKIIDPNSNPIAAQQANITQDGTVVLILSGHQQAVTSITEEELTGALVRLISPESRPIYFMIGEGERSPEGGSNANTGYTLAKTTLQNKGYTVKTINLLADKTIPADAKVVVVAGPQKPLNDDEVQQLDGYLQKGGALVIMEDPLPVTQFGEAADPLAAYLEKSWGLKLGKDIIVDVTSSQASLAAVGTDYASHAITAKMSNNMVSIFPAARSVSIGTPPEGVTLQKLVSTSNRAWGETDFAALKNQQVAPDPKVDLIGPVNVAAVAENTGKKSKLVVFGNSSFAMDQYFSQYGNSDLFINSIDWSAGQESLISLTPKKNTQRLLVPPQTWTLNLILLGSVIILPGLILAAGVVAFFRRRSRG